MAYTPFSLAEIMQQAGQIKGQQQKGQLADLQIQEAQKQKADSEGIDSAIQTDPNVSTTALAQRFGMPGVQAGTQLNAARQNDLVNHYRQTYIAANQIANADDPVATVQQVAPQFGAQYDQVHGQGAFAQLLQNPTLLKQQAAQVAQASLAGLVDPDKQFQAHQTMVEDHYKQEGPGGEAARNANTVNAENARAAASRALEARGQNMANARAGLNPDGTSVVAGPKNGLTGDAFLSSLPSNTAAQVKAIAEGRMEVPKGYALKSPYWQQMMDAVAQYDPSFDTVNTGARAGTRKSFTSGKDAQNVTALNTAIGHAGTLLSQISGTASHSLVPANAVENYLTSAFGGAGPGKFKQTASALASELTTVFRGSGGAEGDVVRNLQALSENASDEQKRAAIGNAVELLNSRLTQLGDKYDQGMGVTSDPLRLLNPHSRQVLQMIQAGSAPASTGSSQVLRFDAQGNPVK